MWTLLKSRKSFRFFRSKMNKVLASQHAILQSSLVSPRSDMWGHHVHCSWSMMPMGLGQLIVETPHHNPMMFAKCHRLQELPSDPCPTSKQSVIAGGELFGSQNGWTISDTHLLFQKQPIASHGPKEAQGHVLRIKGKVQQKNNADPTTIPSSHSHFCLSSFGCPLRAGDSERVVEACYFDEHHKHQ